MSLGGPNRTLVQEWVAVVVIVVLAFALGYLVGAR